MRQDTGELSEDDRMKKPFFTVYAQNGTIILENPDFLEFIISRPLNEIIQFYRRLKE
jgi:hypothetical protein